MNTKQSIVPEATITFKKTSEDLVKKGDYCITSSLGNVKDDKVIEAIVMLCPYCGMAMASTSIHKIKRPRFVFLSKLLSRMGLPYGVTVTPMLQCPYNPAHSFNIKRGEFYK